MVHVREPSNVRRMSATAYPFIDAWLRAGSRGGAMVMVRLGPIVLRVAAVELRIAIEHTSGTQWAHWAHIGHTLSTHGHTSGTHGHTLSTQRAHIEHTTGTHYFRERSRAL